MAINSVFTHECASLVALTVSVVASGDVAPGRLYFPGRQVCWVFLSSWLRADV